MTFMNFDSIKQELSIENQNFSFFNLELLNKEKYSKLIILVILTFIY